MPVQQKWAYRIAYLWPYALLVGFAASRACHLPWSTATAIALALGASVSLASLLVLLHDLDFGHDAGQSRELTE